MGALGQPAYRAGQIAQWLYQKKAVSWEAMTNVSADLRSELAFTHICRGATVVRSVLFEYTRVLPNVSLEAIIVFKDYSVGRDGVMKHVSELPVDAWSNARDRRNKRRTTETTDSTAFIEKRLIA